MYIFLVVQSEWKVKVPLRPFQEKFRFALYYCDKSVYVCNVWFNSTNETWVSERCPNYLIILYLFHVLCEFIYL